MSEKRVLGYRVYIRPTAKHEWKCVDKFLHQLCAYPRECAWERCWSGRARGCEAKVVRIVVKKREPAEEAYKRGYETALKDAIEAARSAGFTMTGSWLAKRYAVKDGAP